MLAYNDGKKHFGWSCPANPALIAPEPCRDGSRFRVIQFYKAGHVADIVDHDWLVSQDVLVLCRHAAGEGSPMDDDSGRKRVFN